MTNTSPGAFVLLRPTELKIGGVIRLISGFVASGHFCCGASGGNLCGSYDLQDADRDASMMGETTAPMGCWNVLVVAALQRRTFWSSCVLQIQNERKAGTRGMSRAARKMRVGPSGSAFRSGSQGHYRQQWTGSEQRPAVVWPVRPSSVGTDVGTEVPIPCL